jgi:hypothetical protein
MGMSKIRSKGEVAGKHAQLQLSERQPIFYVYMPESQTPENFSVIQMKEKNNRREFEVGSAGGASGSSNSGLDVGAVSQVLIERIAHRLYRIRPDRELKDGEYGFIGTFTYASVGLAGSGEKIYDFGVNMKKR